MNAISRTLYIPLYGKSEVSRKGIILSDPKAEEIWSREGFSLHGKAKSKWLAYYMAMRARVFDDWTKQQMASHPDDIVVHIGCGLDSRCERIGKDSRHWFDVDFPAVIAERKKYYQESDSYHMIGADASETGWLSLLPVGKGAVIVMEGVSMYLPIPSLTQLFRAFQKTFPQARVFMDSYTVFAAKASKYKNPVRDVGAAIVSGIDDPRCLEQKGVFYLEERSMTPARLISELNAFERVFFQHVLAGKTARKLYRVYEYEINVHD